MAKYSKQRQLILETLMENPVHPTADWVYNRLKPENPELSMGTVYRNLNLLTDQGKIKKVSIPGEADRFDGEISCHIHFRCLRCNQVSDLGGETLREMTGFLARVHELTGNVASPDHLVLEGVCKLCKSDH